MTVLERVNFGMSTPAEPASLQVPEELDRFIELLKREGVRSYLEIGVRYGGTFEAAMKALPPGSLGVALDFPGGDFGDDKSIEHLMAAAQRLRWRKTIRCIFGPSSAVEVCQRAAGLGPFDAILIDGDHAYHAVRRDYEMYAPFGRIIALHDIAAPAGMLSRRGCKLDVARYWNEIKGRYPHEEIVAPGSVMGFGVIYRH